MMDIQEIAVDEIKLGKRFRDITPDNVNSLCQSIIDQGLQNPILIRPARLPYKKDLTVWGKEQENGFILVSGAHRLTAIKQLGWETVSAIIVDPETPLNAQLMEIDENLFRRELTALERAICLYERKIIYEEKYPNSKGGVAGGKARQGNAKPPIGFAKMTSKEIGLGISAIKDSVKICKDLSPDSIKRIQNTWLADKQTELLNLCRHNHETQAEFLDLMLRDKDPIKTVFQCQQHKAGKPIFTDKKAKARHKLQLAWDNAPEDVKADFLNDISLGQT